MATPLFSTFSAVTELFVTAAVYYFIFSAYKHDVWRKGLISFALVYEVGVNVAYMTFRLVSPSEASSEHGPGMVAFLAGHGILSLVMLLGLIGLVITALRMHRYGHNLFRARPALMWTFVALWAASILSGEAIYVMTYLL